MKHWIVVVSVDVLGQVEPDICTYIIATGDGDVRAEVRLKALTVTHENYEILGREIDMADVIACRKIEDTVAITLAGERKTIGPVFHV
jgi:hypothetical protein